MDSDKELLKTTARRFFYTKTIIIESYVLSFDPSFSAKSFDISLNIHDMTINFTRIVDIDIFKYFSI